MSETTYFIHGPTGLQQQQNPDGSWVWTVEDGLNSIRGVVDSAVNPLESRQYDPYGVLIETSGTNQTPFGFTGEITDSNGLVYLRARYFNPNLGVFPNPDPFEGSPHQPMSLNRYSYVENNTVNRVDPTGMMPQVLNMIQSAAQSGNFDMMRRTIEKINTGCYRFDPNEQVDQNDRCWCYVDGSLDKYTCQIHGAGLCPPKAPTATPDSRNPCNIVPPYPVFGYGPGGIATIVGNNYGSEHPAIDIVPNGAFVSPPFLNPDWDTDTRNLTSQYNNVYAAIDGELLGFTRSGGSCCDALLRPDPKTFPNSLYTSAYKGFEFVYIHIDLDPALHIAVPNGKATVKAGQFIGRIINHKDDPANDKAGDLTHLRFGLRNPLKQQTDTRDPKPCVPLTNKPG